MIFSGNSGCEMLGAVHLKSNNSNIFTWIIKNFLLTDGVLIDQCLLFLTFFFIEGWKADENSNEEIILKASRSNISIF